MAPAGTQRPVIDRLYAESARALRSPELVHRFTAQGLDIHAAGPEDFAARIRSDEKVWSGIVKASGAKFE